MQKILYIHNGGDKVLTQHLWHQVKHSYPEWVLCCWAVRQRGPRYPSNKHHRLLPQLYSLPPDCKALLLRILLTGIDLLIEVCVGGIRAKEKHLPFSEITDNWKFHILTSRCYLSLKIKEINATQATQTNNLPSESWTKTPFLFSKIFCCPTKKQNLNYGVHISIIHPTWIIHRAFELFSSSISFPIFISSILVESYCDSQQNYGHSFLNLFLHCWHTAKGTFLKQTSNVISYGNLC